MDFGGKAPTGAKFTPDAASREAHMGVQGNLTERQRAVLKLFLAEGPMAEPRMREAAKQHGVRQSESGLRTRRRELGDMVPPLLHNTGTYVILPDTGNKASVWDLTEHGKNIAHGL